MSNKLSAIGNHPCTAPQIGLSKPTSPGYGITIDNLHLACPANASLKCGMDIKVYFE